MYCSECGKSAQGKFCWNCGTPLTSGAASAPGAAPVDVTGPTAAFPLRVVNPPDHPDRGEVIEVADRVEDWETEVRYEAIVRFPNIRAIIERHAAQAPKRMSGEQFLQIAEKVLPQPVPLDKVALIAQPIYASLGIATGKERMQVIEAPVGRVIVRILCSLARHGQTLRGVKQAADGCFFEAVLPSDFRSFEGDMLVTVRRREWKTEVTSATKIKGQLFDWGKSRRSLDEFFADLQLDPAA
jgi:hypothetical protein